MECDAVVLPQTRQPSESLNVPLAAVLVAVAAAAVAWPLSGFGSRFPGPGHPWVLVGSRH
jgi:hypothetical protein